MCLDRFLQFVFIPLVRSDSCSVFAFILPFVVTERQQQQQQQRALGTTFTKK